MIWWTYRTFSGGLRMRFSDAAGDIQKPIISIDYLADVIGHTINLKAICHRHKNCICWVRSKASQNSRLQIVERFVSWGAIGRMQSASDHAASAAEIKVVDFGMRVRFIRWQSAVVSAQSLWIQIIYLFCVWERQCIYIYV